MCVFIIQDVKDEASVKEVELRALNDEVDQILNSGSPGNLQDLTKEVVKMNGKWTELFNNVDKHCSRFQTSEENFNNFQGKDFRGNLTNQFKAVQIYGCAVIV